jgi:diphthamide synthase (EF-2-diphthine--ammonia ligase)
LLTGSVTLEAVWSSDKDSAWTLHAVRDTGLVEVVGLLTTVNGTYERASMHGVRAVLLNQQAEAAGLPLREVPIPVACTNELYEEAMARCRAPLRRGTAIRLPPGVDPCGENGESHAFAFVDAVPA